MILRQALRDLRGERGRLLYFAACVAVGVMAVVAVAGLGDSLERGIRRESKQLLGADLSISSWRVLGEDVERALTGLDHRRSDLAELATLVAAAQTAGGPARSQLVELKAVDEGYPFYGVVETEPADPLPALLAGRGAVVATELLTRLDLGVGDELRIGSQSFTVRARLLHEPDRVAGAFTLGPRVFIARSALEETGLVTFGSRVLRRVLVALDDPGEASDLDAIAETLRGRLEDPGVRVETYTQAQPSLRRGLRRLAGFLGLVALLSLLVGGVGIAQSVRAWLDTHVDAIATLKCLGWRPRQVLTLYLVQSLLLGLLGAALGAVAGVGALLLVPGFLPDPALAAYVEPWQPRAVLRGITLGVTVAVVFSLPSLLSILRVPPARVFRSDAQPLPATRRYEVVALALTVIAIAAMATLQAGDWDIAWRFTAGVLGTALALLVAGALLRRAVARVPRGAVAGSVALRHGLAAIARPGAATQGAVLALGLGLLVVLAMSLVEHSLTRQLTNELPEDAPSSFLIGIQPEQWPDLEDALRSAGVERLESVPVIVARLAAVDGRDVGELTAGADRSRRWALTREQRLTYLDTLPASNELLAGSLWSRPGVDEVSVEEEFADELGIGIGSTLVFDVQGVPIELTVTSRRRVDWESFDVNFFLIAEPEAMTGAPQARLAAIRVPPADEQRVQDLVVASFPNVTVIQVRQLLERVLVLLRKLALGVRVLGGFTVVSALAILAGAIAAGASRRGAEVALLKTLGMTRLGVSLTFATEYALQGAIAGLIGGLGGVALSAIVVTQGIEVEWHFEPWRLVATLGAGVLLSVVAGVLASGRALRRRPIEVLRDA
ncbi:MAG TPA: FtsX-like permease family protein [Thermoanaerobaculia bacterium]|nr:FtsX-like permease family protein [Thermoanaerobaculia bacterium]